MFSSAAAPSTNTALPGAVEGPSTSKGTKSKGTRAANAANFLALLGSEKAGAGKPAKGKATLLPATAAPVDDAATSIVLAAKAGAKPETHTALADAAKAALSVKTARKSATEIKAEGDAGKAQVAAALPAAILEALAATAKAKPPTATVEATTADLVATPDEAGKVKIKPARPSARREGEAAVKTDAALKSPDPADAARVAKAETHPVVTPATAKPANSEAAAGTFTPRPSSDPLPQPPVAGAQITDTHIPLSTREAAQAGFVAPVLAMRTISKDGVMKSIEIRLDPVELGKVDVKLETGHDGKLQAVVSAENADAFELLKKDSGALEAALREAGVDLGEGGLTFALNDSGAGQSQQREAAYGGATARRAASAGELAASAAVERSTWRNGVIDISV